MEEFKGMIALDIDGTLTESAHHLPPNVVAYLSDLIAKGWTLMFLTGRTFSFAKPVLAPIRGEYHLAAQNGTSLFTMPGAVLEKEHFMSTATLHEIDPKGGILVVESGKINNDLCYYREEDVNPYIQYRMSISPEKWVSIDSFQKLSVDLYAVGKFFSDQEAALELKRRLEHQFEVTIVRDPFQPGAYISMIHAKESSKGRIVREFAGNTFSVIIAAGNDYNDLEMLHASDVKIVMQNAPKEMHSVADILADHVENEGILGALEEAISRYGRTH